MLATSQKELVESQKGLVATVDELARTVSKFVESGEARSRQLEASLDGLIRAIAQEHSNGKGRIS
jgi:hypothetical protein